MFLLWFLSGSGALLRGDGPGWDDAVDAGVRDDLTEVLVCVGDENVDDIAGIRFWAELGLGLREFGVGHIVDGAPGELPGFIELVDDLSFVGCGRFEVLEVQARRRRDAHQSENAVAFTGNVEEDGSNGAGTVSGAPREFVGGNPLRGADEFLVHPFEILQGLWLHIVARRSGVFRLGRLWLLRGFRGTRGLC